MENPTSTAAVESAEPIETAEAEAPETSEETPEVAAVETDKTAKAEKEIEKLENKPNLTKKEVKKLNQLRIKVDGKELTEDLPFDLPKDPKAIEYLKKELQMAKMGSKRAQDFASLQKEAVDFIDRLKKDPFSVLSDPNLGVDIREQVQKYIEKELENQKKSPEQLDKERLETELRKLQEEREKEKEAIQQRELQLLQEKAYEEYDRQISEAIEKSTLPKSPYIIKRVADWMLMGLNEGLDVTADDVLPLVEEQMKQDLKDMFAIMPEDVVESLIGKEKLGKIRKKNIAKAKTVLSSKAPDTGITKTNKEESPKEKKSFKDFFGV